MENKFGKLSSLNLTAMKKGDKTILSEVSFTAPFKIMSPFYEKKDFMTVMLLTASAGIMAGDQQEFTLRIKEGAKMEFVSQAYEKIHKMNEGFAKRQTLITVEPQATLHYTPLPTIPFAQSDYRNTLRVDLADETSRFVFSEILSCGRLAHGEKFLYHRYQNLVEIYQAGKIVYRDNTCYMPKQMDMPGFGMYEGFTHLANLVICNEARDEAWVSAVRSRLEEDERVEGGVTRTAAGHLVIRILGHSGQKLTDLLEEILQLPV